MQKMLEKEKMKNEEQIDTKIQNKKAKELLSKFVNSIWFVVITGILLFLQSSCKEKR